MGDIVDPLADDQVEVASHEKPSKRQKSNDSCNEGPSGRSKRFYSKPRETVISDDLLEILTSVFTKPLSKEAGTELLDKYASIKGTGNLLVSPTMKTDTKEDIKKKHGYLKTKEVFAIDEGLAEEQGPLLTAVRPIMTTLEALDMSSEENEDFSGPELVDIKIVLEVALALLGNAVSVVEITTGHRSSLAIFSF